MGVEKEQSATDTEFPVIRNTVVGISNMKIIPGHSDMKLIRTDPGMLKEEEELYHYASMKGNTGVKQPIMSKVEMQPIVEEIESSSKAREEAMGNEIVRELKESKAREEALKEAMLHESKAREDESKAREDGSKAREEAMLHEFKAREDESKAREEVMFHELKESKAREEAREEESRAREEESRAREEDMFRELKESKAREKAMFDKIERMMNKFE